MINYDEEIKKFTPSLEVEDAEEAIYNTQNPDVMDLLAKILDKVNEE